MIFYRFTIKYDDILKTCLLICLIWIFHYRNKIFDNETVIKFKCHDDMVLEMLEIKMLTH
jgi:hypothetical protein